MSRKRLEVIVDRVHDTTCPHCGAYVDVAVCVPLTTADCPSCGRVLTVPGRLGAFVLLELLGRGGMGAVYRALDTTLNRQVAIKVMREALGQDIQFSADLAQEARAAAALNHPHVAHIYAFGEEKGQPYIVMELAAGGRLDRMIRREGPLEEAWALKMAFEVAQGLHAAHEAGLIHADIKPANIVFDEKGAAKVVDFGLAQSAAHAIEGGESWGTPFYVAPEQVRKQKIDHRADIYSLGATLFHALTGRAPFDEGESMKTVKARFERPAPDVRELRPGLTEATARIVARMLAEKRAARYPTYASLLADLGAAREVLRKGAATPPQRRGAPASTAPRSWVLPALLVGLFLLVAGSLVFKLRRPPPAGDASSPSAPPPPAAPAAKPSPGREQPSPGAGVSLDEVVQNLAEGKGFAAAQQVEHLRRELAPDDPLRPWVLLLQAFSGWSESLDAGVQERLAEVTNDEVAVGLARFMSGEAKASALREQASNWDARGQALAELMLGVQALREGAPGGVPALEQYREKAAGLSGWAGDFTPLADRWIADAETCTRGLAQAEALSPHARKQALTGLKGNVAPLFHRRIDEALTEATALADEEARKRRRQQDERDREQVASLKEALPALAAERAFDQALARVKEAAEGIKNRAVRSELDPDLARYTHLGALQAYLVAQISAQPPRGPVPGLGRSIEGADGQGVTLTGGAGLVSWTELNVRAWLSLFDLYLGRSEAAASEKAKLLLGAALFCEMEGGPGPALTYARQAMELSPDLEAEARGLMPELAWSP